MKAFTQISLKTPIGLVKLIHSGNGINEIQLDKDYNDESSILNKDFSSNAVKTVSIDGPVTEKVDQAIVWIQEFFNPLSLHCPLPDIDNEIVTKDSFTGLVLRTLMNDIKTGYTISYAELAGLCGNSKACRAVGQAMRANPVPLVVPCHRVIASNGGLGHYMSGNGDNIKSWLIAFEKNKNA